MLRNWEKWWKMLGDWEKLWKCLETENFDGKCLVIDKSEYGQCLEIEKSYGKCLSINLSRFKMFELRNSFESTKWIWSDKHNKYINRWFLHNFCNSNSIECLKFPEFQQTNLHEQMSYCKKKSTWKIHHVTQLGVSKTIQKVV